MGTLKDRVEIALNKSRMLMLGAQVLIGFQYQAVFQQRFQNLSFTVQCLNLAALALLLVTLTLLLAPIIYHQLVEAGKDTMVLDHFESMVVEMALLPFAVAMGLDMHVATTWIGNGRISAVAGTAVTLLALLFWYGLEVMARIRRTEKGERPRSTLRSRSHESITSLKDRIAQVLVEARVVLPGVQALLGFQFVTILTETFDSLPAASKYLHLLSLVLITLSTILLMTPAAYHRIVEEGNNSERFYSLASRLVIAATAILALGISGDFFVVVHKVTHSPLIAGFAAAAVVAGSYSLWFGYSLFCRRSRA